MGEAWRLFIALELPGEVLAAIARAQDSLKRAIPEQAVRWVRPEAIHLTLKFLGDVPREQMAAVQEGLSSACAGHHPLALGIEGVGCFPNSLRPRVVWLGVTGDVQKLAALQESVERHIAPLGFPTEGRGFTPHLTLGRTQRSASRDAIAQIGRAVDRGIDGQLATWQVDGVSLIRSQLRPEGALYTTLFRVGLGQ